MTDKDITGVLHEAIKALNKGLQYTKDFKVPKNLNVKKSAELFIHNIIDLKEIEYSIEKLQAVLDAEQWQPIETAPSDGSSFLVAYSHGAIEKVKMWKHGCFEQACDPSLKLNSIDAIGWKHLPKLTQKKGDESVTERSVS